MATGNFVGILGGRRKSMIADEERFPLYCAAE